jgi:hypothetical protein
VTRAHRTLVESIVDSLEPLDDDLLSAWEADRGRLAQYLMDALVRIRSAKEAASELLRETGHASGEEARQ